MKIIVLFTLLTMACGGPSISYGNNNGTNYLTMESSGDDIRDFRDLSDKAHNMCREQGALYMSVIAAQGGVYMIDEERHPTYSVRYVCR